MPPRTKASPEAASRRSSRLAAQPKPEAAEAPAPKKAAPKKKRAADADDGGEGAGAGPAKKSKAGEAESEDESDEKAAVPVLKTIDVGDVLPSYTLRNEKDEEVDVASLAAEKGVVIFLVPKADTPGCTTQACGFRDIYPDFTSHNFDVYCLSADKPVAQGKWQAKKNLPYPLLSDPQRVLISALGAGEGGKTKRSHFIFEKGGKLVEKKVPVKPADSPRLALEFVKGLNA